MPSTIMVIALLENGCHLASHADDGTIKIWDSMYGTCMGNVKELTTEAVDTLCFPPLY